jgi:ATP-dependent Lon protease
MTKISNNDDDCSNGNSNSSENDTCIKNKKINNLKLKNTCKKYSKQCKNNKNEDEDEDNKDKDKSKKNPAKKNKPLRKYITRSQKQTKKYEDDNDEDEGDDDDDDDYVPDEDSENSETDSYDGDSDGEDSDEEDETCGNFNIFFTISAPNDDEVYSDDDNYDTENEDDAISSESDSNDGESNCDSNSNSESNCDSNSEYYYKKSKNNKNQKRQQVTKSKNDRVKDDKNKNNRVKNDKGNSKINKNENKVNDNEDILKILNELKEKTPNNLVDECIQLCKDKIITYNKKQDKKNKKEKERNERIFKRIMTDKNTMNDLIFFNKMELEQQKIIIKELREINKIIRSEKPYRLTLLESKMPTIFKATAMKKIGLMKNMDVGSGEYYKIKYWVDTFIKIPFGVYKTLPVSINNGVEGCTEFMENARNILNTAVYGLEDAKMQIMQLLGQLITNPTAVGTAIGIRGSPGTGKTNLAKEGISKILNRPFAFIALGGATDSSFLEGHSYTYEGSSWGKIVQILIDSQCMNPVIYFDELDKISDTPKGEEIVGILTHLIDTSQNSQFHDKYFAEIDFDLSKCLFIFTYNDESKINPILRDRMYKINIKNYNRKEKVIIANDYLLPKIREQVKFDMGDIFISDENIHYIIDNYCSKEDGVRNLKRCLEIIHTKLNLCRLVKPTSTIFEENSITTVNFPLNLTKDAIDKLIKQQDIVNPSLSYLYI